MIFYFLSILLILYSFFNFKNSFVLFLGFKMFLNTNITIVSVPGIPILTLDLAVTLFYAFSLLVHKGKYQCARCQLPFKVAFVLLFASWSVSAIFSTAGFNAELPVLFKNSVNKLLFIWVLWETIETKDDFAKVFKVVTVVFFVSGIYGLFETATWTNPLLEYEKTLNHDTEKVISWSYAESGRGYRINSIFEHAIGAGLNWGLFSSFTIGILLNKRHKIPRQTFALITAVLSLICLFLTRSRTPMIFFAICLIGMFDFKKKNSYYWAISTVILVFFIIPYMPDNTIKLIVSIFDSSIDVGGSSLTARLDQLSAAWSLMSQSYVFGLGSKFLATASATLVQRLLGGESIWFQVLPCYGIFGIICYVTEVAAMIWTVPVKFHSRETAFLSLAYWAAVTVSSVPGFHEYLFFLAMFYFIKQTARYNQYPEGRYKIYFSNFKICYRKKKADSLIHD